MSDLASKDYYSQLSIGLNTKVGKVREGPVASSRLPVRAPAT